MLEELSIGQAIILAATAALLVCCIGLLLSEIRENLKGIDQ